MIHAINSGVAQLGEMGDVIQYVISPISIPVKATTLQIHIKKNAFLVHVAETMPVAMDEAGVLEFLEPLFAMQRMGSRNNVLIATGDRMATGDALLVWQLFGGIAMPLIGNLDATLKILDQMLQVPLNGLSGEKRAVQFTTNLPYPELDICDNWSMEQVLVYALVNGKLSHKDEGKELFNLSGLDRDVLLRDIGEKNNE